MILTPIGQSGIMGWIIGFVLLGESELLDCLMNALKNLKLNRSVVCRKRKEKEIWPIVGLQFLPPPPC